MPMSELPPLRTNSEISALYVELANECFKKAAIEERAEGAEVFRRMGHRYISEARVYDATLSQKMLSEKLDRDLVRYGLKCFL